MWVSRKNKKGFTPTPIITTLPEAKRKAHRNDWCRGFTLIEMVVFIGVTVFVVAIITGLLVTYIQAYVAFESASRINTAALNGGGRITREVRLANNVDVAGSVFGTHPGKLVLDTTSGGAPATVEFFLDGTILKIKQDGITLGALTQSDVNVDRLIFSHASIGSAQLIRVEIDISTVAGSSTRSATFVTSSSIRGAY